MNEQKDTGLKWLNLDAIHAHCRIDFNCEDAELEQMAMTAEQAILDLTRRTFENFIGDKRIKIKLFLVIKTKKLCVTHNNSPFLSSKA